MPLEIKIFYIVHSFQSSYKNGEETFSLRTHWIKHLHLTTTTTNIFTM